MFTKKGLNLSGFIAANPMAKFSDFAWTDAACNDADGGGGGLGNNLAISSTNATNYFTAGELNLMSRFSLNSSLTLNTAGTDSDTTSSSASSSSATINSSSLSLSPANERDNVRFSNSHNNAKPTHQASNHLLELQKEIKEEEEEIFADINSLINGRSNLYSTFDDDQHDDGVELDEDIQPAFNPIATPSLSSCNNNNNNSQLPDFHNQTAVEIHFSDSSENLNDYQSQFNDDISNHDFHNSTTGTINDEQPKHTNIHQDHHQLYHHQENDLRLDYMQKDEGQYFHDGEDQQHPIIHESEVVHYFDEDQEQIYTESCDLGKDPQDYQALQAVIQQVTNNLPKPCVFFLEGNCRRSDCKYSHDLSNITCKYWIEGFCFKGKMCPFLHSYNPPSDSSLLDDDGLQSITKKELNPTFVIESEADFPSLPLDAPTSAIEDSTKSSINGDILATSIKNQILSSNPAVVFKTVKKKRKRG